MNEKEITKDIRHQMCLRFWMAALGCFAVITLVSLALWGVCQYVSMQKLPVVETEAAKLIEKIDDLRIGGNDLEELEEMKAVYEGLSDKQKNQVTEERYERILEAAALEEVLEKNGNLLEVPDKSGNGYDMSFGADKGMALRRRAGKIVFEGQALAGGDEADDTFQRLVNGHNSFTIEAELNPNDWGYSDGDFNMIASKGDNCAAFRISSQSVYFFIKNVYGEWKGVKIKLTREQMNSWLHVAAVYDEGDVSVYLEGEGFETLADAGMIAGSEYPLGIGYCPETQRGSKSSIKSFRVYSRALTKEELDEGACAPEDKDVVVWYDFADYICPGLDMDIRGVRSYVDFVKILKGESVQVPVEPIPYYAREEIVYRVEPEGVAEISPMGTVSGLEKATVMVKAEAEGTDFSVAVPVDIGNIDLSFRNVLEWIVQRMFLIDAAAFAICLFCIVLVQRRLSISYLTKLSEAVYFIGKDTRGTELPPILGNTQNLIREVEDSLHQKESAVNEAEKRKNDMVVYLAHDLKTPIASLIGYLTLLRDEEQISPEIHRHYIEVALNNSQRLDELVSEFFEITQCNLSYLTLAYREICLTWMLEQMIAEFEPMLAEKGLTCKLEAQEDIYLRCDAEKIERVFDNLLRNAINYSLPNTEICLALTVGEKVTVTCTNYGETIPREALSHIFEQFYRLDSARSSRTGGSGLGLAIVKQLVELHHGEIKAESKDGQICFTVTLPLQ